MRGTDSEKGFTLLEMVVVIAIIMVLAGISCMFFFRNLDRPKAVVNGANLRAVRTILEAELLIDPEHPDEVLDRVLSDAPGAVGMDTPGMSIPDGTPMDAVIGDDGVDTFYNGYNAEDFENLYQDEDAGEEPTGEPSGEPEESTEAPRCALPTCDSADLTEGGYCGDHQVKICGKSLRSGDGLVPCGREYRDYCWEEHYKMGPCPCEASSSKNRACSNCGHYHDPGVCYELALVPDNRADEAYEQKIP